MIQKCCMCKPIIKKRIEIMDKFHGEKFSILEIQINMIFASMDLWAIIDKSKEGPFFGSQNVEKYQRRV